MIFRSFCQNFKVFCLETWKDLSNIRVCQMLTSAFLANLTALFLKFFWGSMPLDPLEMVPPWRIWYHLKNIFSALCASKSVLRANDFLTGGTKWFYNHGTWYHTRWYQYHRPPPPYHPPQI